MIKQKKKCEIKNDIQPAVNHLTPGGIKSKSRIHEKIKAKTTVTETLSVANR